MELLTSPWKMRSKMTPIIFWWTYQSKLLTEKQSNRKMRRIQIESIRTSISKIGISFHLRMESFAYLSILMNILFLSTILAWFLSFIDTYTVILDCQKMTFYPSHKTPKWFTWVPLASRFTNHQSCPCLETLTRLSSKEYQSWATSFTGLQSSTIEPSTLTSSAPSTRIKRAKSKSFSERSSTCTQLAKLNRVCQFTIHNQGITSSTLSNTQKPISSDSYKRITTDSASRRSKGFSLTWQIKCLKSLSKRSKLKLTETKFASVQSNWVMRR